MKWSIVYKSICLKKKFDNHDIFVQMLLAMSLNI